MNGEQLSALLTGQGLDEIEAARKRLLGDLVLEHFRGIAGEDRPVALWVPGRIEVFGKHTDYGGGHSLVAPVPRGFIFMARVRSDRVVTMADAARAERFSIDLDDRATVSGSGDAPTGWRRYAATTVHRLSRNFPGAVRGADIAFASDLPPASGMSSSSALMVGLAATLIRLGNIDASREWQAAIGGPADAAGYYACIENGLSFAALTGDAGVGTHGGSEDHVAMTCGRAGHVSAWRFAPIQHVADVTIPPDWMFVIAASGVAAKKTGAAKDAYNRLSFLVRTLLDLWNATEPRQPSLHAVLSSSPRAAERLTALVNARSAAEPSAIDLENRLSHFRNEDTRIPEAVRTFRGADRERISTLSDDSQSDAEVLLQNQVPETIALARAARTLGAFGASSFGAGFGGSVWALVKRSEAADFAARWLADYRSAFPHRESATVFLAPPGPPLTWIG
ncbi:MAG TPA: galactokinase family protein [Vicinamibacterales bacterium]|nr:galactokinase family protein [Vicinamibacterales bacterium]